MGRKSTGMYARYHAFCIETAKAASGDDAAAENYDRLAAIADDPVPYQLQAIESRESAARNRKAISDRGLRR